MNPNERQVLKYLLIFIDNFDYEPHMCWFSAQLKAVYEPMEDKTMLLKSVDSKNIDQRL